MNEKVVVLLILGMGAVRLYEDYVDDVDRDDDDEEDRFKKRKISRRDVGDEPAPPVNMFETVVEVQQNTFSPKLLANCGSIESSDCSCRLKDPCAIPCLHVFCRWCITTWLRRPNTNQCPTCRSPVTVTDIKSISCVRNIVNNAKAAFPCPSCGVSDADLDTCEHCSQSICPNCRVLHLHQVKREISELCQTLSDEIGPELEKEQLKMMELMSESTAAKERLSRELLEVHDNMVVPIHGLLQKSMETLDNVEKVSRSESEQHMKDVDALVARIDAISASSAKIIAERDIIKLTLLNEEISKLRVEMDDLLVKVSNNNATSNIDPTSGKISLGNVKVNPAYKHVVTLISETDMLQRIDM